MYLGLDLGTTHAKAVVVDRRRRVVGSGSMVVDRLQTPDCGVEQDIEQIWDATCAAIRQAVQGIDAPVESVGVSSQGGALQLLDAEHCPLGRVVSWLDSRGEPFDVALTREWGVRFLITHLGHGVSAMTLGQIVRMQSQMPTLFERARHLAFVGDLIVHRLCGRRAHDPTSLAIAMLFNPWLQRADPEVLVRLAIDHLHLPDLLPITTPAGMLHAKAAQATGLRQGVPVSPAMHDQYAVSLGAGAVNEGDVTFGAGTAWVLLANGGRLVDPIVPEAFVCAHPVPGLFGQMLSLRNGGSAIQWMLDLLGRGRASIDAVDQWLSETPPGSDGLCFRPLLSPGTEVGGSARGSIAGLTLTHGPSHLIRATVEGLACELALRLDWFKAAGLPVARLLMCGSAAASRQTPQIIADVTQCPVACVDAFDVSALGAATVAAALVEEDSSLAPLARATAGIGKTFEPQPDCRVYSALLDQYRNSTAGNDLGAPQR